MYIDSIYMTSIKSRCKISTFKLDNENSGDIVIENIVLKK